ncbi:MAG: hypothetical protein JWQ27_2403 [Ferruginibacter sp.]|nr:hypothetical protein [Ferruginibacter sp.]
MIRYFSLVFLVGLVACDPCEGLDCVTSDYDAQFRLLDKANGSDLLFGPGRRYDQHQLKFYALNGADTTFFVSQVRSGATGTDSILSVLFVPAPELAYLRLSNGDVDTLNITYDSRETKCCGTIRNFSTFRYNQLPAAPGADRVTELRK